MKRSLKTGAGKTKEESAPTISQGDESIEEIEEEGLEEAQAPLPLDEETDEPTKQEIAQADVKGDIFVTLAIYSRKYKDLSAKQYQAGAVEARGLVDLGVGIFAPGEIYRLKITPETEKLIQGGCLIRMSGSFGKRAANKEEAK